MRKNAVDIPLSLFIRVVKLDGEAGERAMIIVRDERGKEYTFMFEDSFEELRDLTVCDMPAKKLDES